MQLSSVYSLCITVNEDLDNGNGVCTFQKYGDQRQLQSFVVSILPLGSSTVCVCSCWKFIFSCPAVGCTAWVAGGGGGGFLHISALWELREHCEETWHALPIFRLKPHPTRRMRRLFEEHKKKLGTLHPDKYDLVSSRLWNSEQHHFSFAQHLQIIYRNCCRWFRNKPALIWITDQSVINRWTPPHRKPWKPKISNNTML